MIELFDFDRCTGMVSNPIPIEMGVSFPPEPMFWSCAFSPDGTKLYITSNTTSSLSSSLYQYDLTSSNITVTKDTIWSMGFPTSAGGGLKLAPNGKIYLSKWYYNGIQNPYPYADSVYNMYNMNLSVINSPNSLGNSCNFIPWSFYLGGKRTYVGLPNNPDYELGPLVGSPCDTLTAIAEQPLNSQSTLFIYYASGWDKAFINADKLNGQNYHLRMIDILGKEVYAESGILNSQYFTRDLNCSGFSEGIYLITFETEEERLVKKFQVVK